MFCFVVALGTVRAGESLDELKSKVDLQHPGRIFATNMRKYTATLAQVLLLHKLLVHLLKNKTLIR